MLIFDKFSSREQAEAFAATTTKRFGLETIVCDSHEESDQIDPFPFRLYPPIVLVERGHKEQELERSVQGFGGRFAGT
jgi:hypothetical protein